MNTAHTPYALDGNVLEWVKKYVDWSVKHGFVQQKPSARDMIAPEMYENTRLSPFFDPQYYLLQSGFNPKQRVNAYLHYFTQGWRDNIIFSRLIDVLALRECGFTPSGKAPLLIDVIDQLEKDDLFSPHILFDASVFRRFSPRKTAAALVEFIREPVSVLFSPYVDLDMLNAQLACWNIRSENAFLCYLEAPPGTDINPFLFTMWYDSEYKRTTQHTPPHRDLLSDYILVGCKKGFFPNPFLQRDFAGNSGGCNIHSVLELSNAILVPKNMKIIHGEHNGVRHVQRT